MNWVTWNKHRAKNFKATWIHILREVFPTVVFVFLKPPTTIVKPLYNEAQETCKICSLLRGFVIWRVFPLYFSIGAIFVWTWKMASVSVRYLFYRPMDEKIKTLTLRFPAKENPNMEKALFDWPIVLQYDVKAWYRLISRKFFGHEVFSSERSLNQPKATRVCIRSTNQSNRSIFVRLLFLSCSRVFISRSYENRTNGENNIVRYTEDFFI